MFTSTSARGSASTSRTEPRPSQWPAQTACRASSSSAGSTAQRSWRGASPTCPHTAELAQRGPGFRKGDLRGPHADLYTRAALAVRLGAGIILFSFFEGTAMRLAISARVLGLPILGAWLGCNAIIGLELGEPEP